MEVPLSPETAHNLTKFRLAPEAVHGSMKHHLAPEAARDLMKYRLAPEAAHGSMKYHLAPEAARDLMKYRLAPGAARGSMKHHLAPEAARDLMKYRLAPEAAHGSMKYRITPSAPRGLMKHRDGARSVAGRMTALSRTRSVREHGFQMDHDPLQARGSHLKVSGLSRFLLPTFLCGRQRKVGAAPHRGNANRPLRKEKTTPTKATAKPHPNGRSKKC